MQGAFGLATMIVVVGVFMPKVLHALQTFLLLFFDKAAAVLQNVQF
jgi:hypothetical protein